MFAFFEFCAEAFTFLLFATMCVAILVAGVAVVGAVL